MIYNDITELIGRTPLMRLNKISKGLGVELLVKLEAGNPGGSIKDRIALAMINEAEKAGRINPQSVLIEPTSGNTGVGLAMVAAVKGYRLILTMPETMSIERRRLLQAYGAEIVLTSGVKGMQGAIDRAWELSREIENSLILQQFENPANPAVHRQYTAQEIIQAIDGKIDFLVAGVGTGGTITGLGQVLKQKYNGLQVVAVEPSDSPVLSGGKPGSHQLQGIGAGFIPQVLDQDILDQVIKIDGPEAMRVARELAKTEGILVGISGGAAVCGALKIARFVENKGKRIVIILPDSGERYLSTDLFK